MGWEGAMRSLSLIGLFLVGAAFGSTARAGDDAAVEDAYQRARAHLKGERWSTAVDSLRRMLANNPGSPVILKRLGAIEADLRLAMFRAQAEHPAAEVLFGKAAKGFIVAERRLTLDYPDGPSGDDWKELETGYYHRIPFDPDMAVEFTAPTIERKNKTIVQVFLTGWQSKDSAEGDGRYLISPGACSEDSSYIYSSPGTIVRFDFRRNAEPKIRELVSKPVPGKVKIGQVQTYRVARRQAGINVSVDGKPFLVCEDGKYPVTTVAILAAGIGTVTIRGVVEKSYYHDLLSERFAVEQRAWEPKGYVRSEILPKWILEEAPQPAAPRKSAK